MIRIVLALLTIIAIFIGLVLFPNIANQPVRIEMFGWLFETRTSMFILLALAILILLWSLQKTFNLSINSPRQLWTHLRSGSKKRRELKLQEALTTWVDQGCGHSQKLLKRSKGVIPEWLHQALMIWWDKPENHPPIHDEKDTPLTIALKARLATEDKHISRLSLSERQHFLDAWLAIHPAAPLALQRKARLLGEMGEYAEQVHLLESMMQKSKDITTLKPQLAHALVHLAAKDTDNALACLRKAHRLLPNHSDIVQQFAIALFDSGDHASAEKILLEYLQNHDDTKVAKSALKVLALDALQNFKRMDKPTFQNTFAGRWLRMMLAYEAGLTGIADDAMNAMLSQHPTPLLWQTKGDWLARQHQWEEATEAYQQALKAESTLTST